MDFYDLNFVPAFSSPILLRTQFEESQCESRTNHFCPNHGVHLSRRISPVRSEIRLQSKCAPTVVLEPVSGDGLCSTDLSPQPSRHRSLFESTAFQALSLRLQSPHPTLHSGRRQRASRLENLRRLCPYSDRHRSASVRRHRSWIGSGLHRFCSSVCPSPGAGFLCRTRQTKLSVPPSRFPNDRPLKRSKKRLNRFTHRTTQSKALSHSASKSQLLLRTNRSIPGLFNQQLLHRSVDRSGPLSLSLAN